MKQQYKNEQSSQLKAVGKNGGGKYLEDNREKITQRKERSEPVQKANNTGLPNQLKSGIENLSGHSMDDVKVHYNSSKPAQLNAHAFAQGNQIHLATGQEKHLAHEAWHVVQQKQGRVKPTKQLKGSVPVNDDAGLEKEADVMGGKALQAKSKEKVTVNQNELLQQKARRLVATTQFVLINNTSEKDTIQRFRDATKNFSQEDWGGVHQLLSKKVVLQANGWDHFYDTLNLASVIAGTISTIAKLVGATGFGWLIPFLFPPVISLIKGIMDIKKKGTQEDKTDKQKYVELITVFVGSVGAIILSSLGTNEKAGKSAYVALAGFITTALLFALETLRVNFLSRNTIYTPLKNRLLACWNKEKAQQGTDYGTI